MPKARPTERAKTLLYTSSPADKKYGSTLPTNQNRRRQIQTFDQNKQIKYNSFDVYHMKM